MTPRGRRIPVVFTVFLLFGVVNRAPIPLLYIEDLPLMPEKSRKVLFAGSCHGSEIRMNVFSLVTVFEGASSEYE
eukprot:7870345-Pyramimonas_sp.AAC.1